MTKAKKKVNLPAEEGENSTLKKTSDDLHLGSSNAFEQTENPFSTDKDDLTDELLDEMIGD
jgi:hypothetical protein